MRRREIVFWTIWLLVCLQVLTGAVAEFVALFATYVDRLPFSVWPIGAMGIVLLILIVSAGIARLFRLVVSEGTRASISARLRRLTRLAPK